MFFLLKGNQGKLRDAVTDYITEHMENDFANIPARRYVETLKGHGRVDEITSCQMPVPKDVESSNHSNSREKATKNEMFHAEVDACSFTELAKIRLACLFISRVQNAAPSRTHLQQEDD